jgi:hypothetical protein
MFSQDYEVGLAGLGNSTRSSGDCDTCILMDLYKDIIAWRWGVLNYRMGWDALGLPLKTSHSKAVRRDSTTPPYRYGRVCE